MLKSVVVILFIALVACDSQNGENQYLTGIVTSATSCVGGPEPVFIIELSENHSIMTTTLPKEFQIPNFKINFKTKNPSTIVYCTDDKVYPEQLDVYDVISVLKPN